MGRAMLIMVSGLMVIYGLIMTSLYDRQEEVGLPVRSADYMTEEQGKNITSSMVDLAIQTIALNDQNGADWHKDWGRTFSYKEFMGGSNVVIEGFDETDTGDADFPADNYIDETGGWDPYRVLLYSTAEFNGRIIQAEVLIEKESFSKFAYYTNTEPAGYSFITGDTLSGPIHTNGTFNISGQPVFDGYVTSPNMWNGDTTATNTPQFNGGSNFNSIARPWPDAANSEIKKLHDTAKLYSLHFTKPIKVIMNGTGSITVYVDEGSGWETATEYSYSKSQYNDRVLSSDKLLLLGGTLDGRLTVHSRENVEIISDINYASNPLTNPESTDILGIVSEKSVIVDKQAHTATGTQDLSLQASIMALLGSFQAEEYWTGDPRGQINLLGGIIQETRGAVGTHSGGSLVSGFNRNYEYDTRLLSDIPPYFPRESSHSIVYWRDRTEVNQ